MLTDGASATNGSDAIGGVVDFILRKNYRGADFSTDYGISDHDDGERHEYHFSFGQTSDKSSIIAGVDYTRLFRTRHWLYIWPIRARRRSLFRGKVTTTCLGRI